MVGQMISKNIGRAFVRYDDRNISVIFNGGGFKVSVADLDYIPSEDYLWFSRLKVATSGQGVGSKIVRIVLKIARRLGKDILCGPNPYDGRDRMEDLVRFYKRHGFVDHEEGMLMYYVK